MSLQRLRECVDELNSTNGSNAKMEILAKYDDCKEYFYYAFNPYYRYGVTSNSIDKKINSDHKLYHDLFDLLDDLRNRVITGHLAITSTRVFLENYCKGFEDLIYMILDKNIEVRMGASLINKVWKKYIPEYKVCLAYPYADHADKVNFDKDEWYSSRKFNGCRLITNINDDGEITFYSREGNEFTSLNVLREELLKFDLKNITLDGEICIIDKNGLEDFKAAVSQVKRKNFTIENPRYKIFDLLPTTDFDEGKYHKKFSERLQDMIDFMNKYKPQRIETARQIKVRSVEHLIEMSNFATKSKWEGLIIRKDIPYVAKRSNNMLKLKEFEEAEYEVVGIETEINRVINKQTGLEEKIELMARANILHKGNIVGVGSGWNLDEKKKYRDLPSLLIGKKITVSYFEESYDKNGKLSLQFPTVKYVWEEGERDV